MIVVVACTRIETLFVRRSHSIRVVRTPMGRAAAAALRRALAGLRPRVIISTGFCGGLDPMLRPGDLVLADRIHHGKETVAIDPSLLALARRELDVVGIPVRVGLLESSEAVAGSPQEKAGLAADGALAVEMEAGPLSAVAEDQGSGFLSLRGVLDVAGDSLPFTALRPHAAELLRRPLMTLRLAGRALRAARAIGRAVPVLADGVCEGSA